MGDVKAVRFDDYLKESLKDPEVKTAFERADVTVAELWNSYNHGWNDCRSQFEDVLKKWEKYMSETAERTPVPDPALRNVYLREAMKATKELLGE